MFLRNNNFRRINSTYVSRSVQLLSPCKCSSLTKYHKIGKREILFQAISCLRLVYSKEVTIVEVEVIKMKNYFFRNIFRTFSGKTL